MVSPAPASPITPTLPLAEGPQLQDSEVPCAPCHPVTGRSLAPHPRRCALTWMLKV